MTDDIQSVKSNIGVVTSALENVTPRHTGQKKYVLYLVSLKRADARILDDVTSSIRANAERIGDYKRLGFKPSQLIESLVSDFCAGVRVVRKSKKQYQNDILRQHFADQRRHKERLKKSSTRTSCNSLSENA